MASGDWRHRLRVVIIEFRVQNLSLKPTLRRTRGVCGSSNKTQTLDFFVLIFYYLGLLIYEHLNSRHTQWDATTLHNKDTLLATAAHFKKEPMSDTDNQSRSGFHFILKTSLGGQIWSPFSRRTSGSQAKRSHGKVLHVCFQKICWFITAIWV